MNRNPRVELVSTRQVFVGRVFTVRQESVRLPSGLRQEVSVVDHPGAVAIAALTHAGELLLVRQYRHAAGDWLIEIPAGRLEAGEQPLEAARRELEEETGHRATEWRVLREFLAAPGFCSEVMTLVLARGLTEAGASARPADPDEEIEVLTRHPSLLLRDGCRDAKTLVAALEVLRLGLSEPA